MAMKKYSKCRGDSAESLRDSLMLLGRWLKTWMHKIKEPRTRSPKTTAKLIQNNVYCFLNITIFRLAIPAFFRFTDVTELQYVRVTGDEPQGTMGRVQTGPLLPFVSFPPFGQDKNGGSRKEPFAFRIWIRVYFDCPWWSPLPYLSLTFTRTSSNKVWPQILQKLPWWSD